MKIFITGGTGLLGKSVVRTLKREGHTLYVLSRNTLENQDNIHYIQGDILSVSKWEKHLEGMDIVIHMAAPVVFWASWEVYEKGIITATKNILETSKRYRVKRMIYISSESVLQDKGNLLDVNESAPYPKEPNSYYGKSKMLAEQSLLKDNSAVEKIIIRPTFIWGPSVPTVKTIAEKSQQGKFMWVNHGASMMEMVHADNVSEMIRLTLTKGENKDIFFVTDDNPKPAKQFLNDLLSTQNVTLTKKSIPEIIAPPAAAFIESIWKIFHLSSVPPMTRFDLAFITQARRYDITKAKSIGYSPVITYQQGLEEMRKTW